MKKGLMIALLSMTLYALAQSVAGDISRANELYRVSQFAQAEAIYRQVLAKEPNNTVAAYNLANALQKQQKYDEAAQLLERIAPSAQPDKKSSIFYNQGVAYTKQKELEKSIEAYKSALRNDPNDQQARENLQKALRERKQKEEENKKSSGGGGGMNEKQADQKLKMLQEKERQLQQRLQNQKGQGGGGNKDW